MQRSVNIQDRGGGTSRYKAYGLPTEDMLYEDKAGFEAANILKSFKRQVLLVVVREVAASNLFCNTPPPRFQPRICSVIPCSSVLQGY